VAGGDFDGLLYGHGEPPIPLSLPQNTRFANVFMEFAKPPCRWRQEVLIDKTMLAIFNSLKQEEK
jgi:hypothetical protein